MARINLGKVVPEKGVDYYTAEEKAELKEELEQDVNARIDENAAAIATNTTNIETNADDIDALESAVATNTTNIATNTSNISTINSALTTIRQNIQTNASDIAENERDIGTLNEEQDVQDTNIQNNTNAIQGLRTDVNANIVDIDAIKSEQLTQNTNIQHNTSDIATNTTNIATNTRNIGTVTVQAQANTDEINNLKNVVIPGINQEQTTQNGRIQTNENDIASIKAEQLTQNTNIQTNAQDISTINDEQDTQDTAIQQNATDIASLETKHDTEVAELQSQIEELQEENQALADQIPTGDATGSDITLSDSARYYFKKMVLGGKSEQETFTGKNKFGITNPFPITNRGVTFIKNNDGTITLNGTATETFSQIFLLQNVVLNGNYTLKHNVIKGTQSDNSYMSIQDSNNNNISDKIYGGTSSANILADNIIMVRASLYIPSGTTFSDYTVGTQVEEGSTATDYEPYTGGQPAPNPDYECPIKNVTGNVEVKAENKNMFDESQLLEANGWVVSNGVYSGIINDWFLKFRNGFIGLFFKENTQYTISFKGYITGGTPRIKIIYTDNTTSTLNISALAMTAYLFTTPAGKTISKVSADYGSAGQNTLYLTEFQIEESSTATDYVPHEEQTAIFPLEEGQILHEGDTIEDKIVQRRGTYQFTGNENWTKSGNTTNISFCCYTNSIRPLAKNNGTVGLLNIGKVCNYQAISGYKNAFAYNVGNSHFLKIEKTAIPNWDESLTDAEKVALFKAYLAEKYANGTPVTLEYELETPLEIPFTQAQRTAKAQIDKLYSYKGTTHITSEADLYVTYRKDQDLENKNLQAQIDELKTSILSLGGNV